MHIEKINDNQIKCTLSQRDLRARNLDLSELAYGTEKARSLFQEMIEQAHDAFGFEGENTPLMVEAIPISQENIILIITRIDNPEELDSRFSRFSSPRQEEDAEEDIEGADEILNSCRSQPQEPKEEEPEPVLDSDLQDLLEQLQPEVSLTESGEPKKEALSLSSEPEASDSMESPVQTSLKEEAKGEASAQNQPANLMRIYAFQDLDTLTEISRILHPLYNGVNSLYKDPVTSVYYLTVFQSHHTPSDFNKVCNILSEYGQRIKGSGSREAYYTEHYECIVSQTALQRLYLF